MRTKGAVRRREPPPEDEDTDKVNEIPQVLEDDPKRRKITRERRETVYNEPNTEDERGVSEEEMEVAEEPEDERDDDDWEDICRVCQTGGKLLCCDTCEAVYHLGCLDPPLSRIPRGEWSCPACCNPLADVEKILDTRLVTCESTEAEDGPSSKQKELYVKWKEKSYRHCSWVSLQDVQNACHEFPGLAHKLRHFQRNHVSTTDQPQDEGLRHGVRAEWSIVDRIIAQRSKKKSRQYLVKWKELSHEECTWEPVADLVGFEAEIQRFHSIRPIAEELGKEKGTGRGKARSREGRAKAKAGKTVKTFTKLDKQPEFMAGGELHPYQLEGLNWLTFAWQTKKHVILADDMVSKDLAGAP
ncbi:hypothetical protein CYMTET_21685 [Cymbomonas tetramitiformis]|uniref:Uncharacterized protein n=1 Tax=Cymbomonas tetramitiformis TaxID=36881 RepID=A0AAE0G1I2_9CHLO|nr:hypothetical protein CYMTET_21685 [Cymbomonas tetramitiformis]